MLSIPISQISNNIETISLVFCFLWVFLPSACLRMWPIFLLDCLSFSIDL